jgi:hypothetical protein
MQIEQNTTYKQLHLGDIVGTTKRMVIACTKKSERVPGDCFATWVAICVKEEELHPYVVWDITSRPDGFHAENGTYVQTLQQAVDHYKKRGGE